MSFCAIIRLSNNSHCEILGGFIMTTEERQRKAEEHGIIVNIGKKVKADHYYAFRSGDTAEIIGWGLGARDNRPLYFIRYENGECDSIPAGKRFHESGFVFVD